MRPNAKPFASLRGKLTELGIEQRYLAKLLDRSLWYVVERLAARSPWDMADMYKLLEIINEPDAMLNYYFPRKQDQASLTRKALRIAK